MIVNLIMVVILVAGAITAMRTRREVFPNMTLDVISIAVPFPGAVADEVEEGVVIQVEEAIQGVSGVDFIESSSRENMGTVMVYLRTDVKDAQKVLDDVKDRVNQIRTFPDDAETPVVSLIDNKEDVIRVALYSDGRADELALKKVAEKLRDDMLLLPEVSSVKTDGAREREMIIEVSDAALERYSLSFDEIADAVNRNDLDISGGNIKTQSEELTLRASARNYRPQDLAETVLRSFPDGTHVLLRDVATVREDFEDTNTRMVVDNKTAVVLKILKMSSDDSIKISTAVKKFVDQRRATLPPGVKIKAMVDLSTLLRARIRLLLKNAAYGFVLIFLILMIFLGYRLSFWVAMGLPFAMLGTIVFMRIPDVTISMMSLFAFLTILGLLVDDAIVVSENVQQHIEGGMDPEQAAIEGTLQVYPAVVAAVLTTLFAFGPFFLVQGVWGKFLKPIPWVSCLGLTVSLFECLLILPAHLAHSLKPIDQQRAGKSLFSRMMAASQRFLNWLINRTYKPCLNLALRFHWQTFVLGFAFFIISLGVIRSGAIKFVFMPEMDSDWIKIEYFLEPGSPLGVHDQAMDRIFAAVDQLNEEFTDKRGEYVKTRRGRRMGKMFGPDEPVIQRTMAVKAGGGRGDGLGGVQSTNNTDQGDVILELLDGEGRGISALSMVNRWRELVGEIPGAQRINYQILAGPSGVSIVEVLLSGDDMGDLIGAAARVKDTMRKYPGAYDVQDTVAYGRRELRLSVNERGRAQGLTLGELIRQVRQGFYGHEIHRVQRGRDEVKVWVRYPEDQRRSIADFENIKVWSSMVGAQIPLREVADIETGRQLRAIDRHKRRRTVRVSAKLDTDRITPDELKNELRKSLPGILEKTPGVDFSLEGQDRDQKLLLDSLQYWYPFALAGIFVCIALTFRNYLHSLMIMTIVPLGLVGALGGHFIIPLLNPSISKMDLTMLSIAGVVALGGIVVNDSIVMIDAIKRNLGNGEGLRESVFNGAVSRFRAIVLTTLTTSIGMMPLMLERSLQAQFLIPMAASISFGLLLGTFFTQLWLPAAFMVLNSIKRAWYLMATGRLHPGADIERNALPGGNFVKGVIPAWMWALIVLCVAAIIIKLRFF